MEGSFGRMVFGVLSNSGPWEEWLIDTEKAASATLKKSDLEITFIYFLFHLHISLLFEFSQPEYA